MPTNFATRVILLIIQRKFQELYHRWFPYLCMQFPLTKWWHIHWIPLISHDYRDYLPVRAPLLHHVDKKPNFAPKNGKIVFFSPHLHTLTILAFPAWLSHLFLWFLDPDELNITKTVFFFSWDSYSCSHNIVLCDQKMTFPQCFPSFIGKLSHDFPTSSHSKCHPGLAQLLLGITDLSKTPSKQAPRPWNRRGNVRT